MVLIRHDAKDLYSYPDSEKHSLVPMLATSNQNWQCSLDPMSFARFLAPLLPQDRSNFCSLRRSDPKLKASNLCISHPKAKKLKHLLAAKDCDSFLSTDSTLLHVNELLCEDVFAATTLGTPAKLTNYFKNNNKRLRLLFDCSIVLNRSEVLAFVELFS